MNATETDPLAPEATADLLAALRARRGALAAALAQTDRMIAELAGSGPQRYGPRPGRGPSGTYHILRQMTAELGPGAHVTVEAAVVYLQSHDWQTRSRNPRNVTAQALAKMVHNGELMREHGPVGIYRTPPLRGPDEGETGG